MTFQEIDFTTHPSGLGFQANCSFDNGYQLIVHCGFSYKEGADTESRSNAGDYTTFEYITVHPVDPTELGPENWVGPVSQSGLMEAIEETYDLDRLGGTGGGKGYTE